MTDIKDCKYLDSGTIIFNFNNGVTNSASPGGNFGGGVLGSATYSVPSVCYNVVPGLMNSNVKFLKLKLLNVSQNTAAQFTTVSGIITIKSSNVQSSDQVLVTCLVDTATVLKDNMIGFNPASGGLINDVTVTLTPGYVIDDTTYTGLSWYGGTIALSFEIWG